MALDERLLLSAPLNQYFVDKDTGLALSGGTLSFKRNSDQSTPKPVYQLSGSAGSYTYTSLGSELTLSAAGTIENNAGDNVALYLFPYTGSPDGNSTTVDLYYIECRNSDGDLQWTREAWPNISTSNDPTLDSFHANNELANPQFTRIFINQNESTVYSVSGETKTYAFAPDWDFVISGSGTVTVQRIAISGADTVDTNPPYVLQINTSTGITDCKLRQRLKKNSGLYSGGYISGNFVARNEGAGEIGLTLYYQESSGSTATTPISILNESGVTTSYQEFRGSVEIPESNNTDVGEDGYVDIYLSIPEDVNCRVTSLQVAPTRSLNQNDRVPYDQVPANREQAFMGSYYIPNLEKKTADSLLIGWDFPVNPAQAGLGSTIISTAKYIADQTIAKASSGSVAVARNSITNGLQFTTSSENKSFVLWQYIDTPDLKRAVDNFLSVNVNAFKTATGDPVTVKAYLLRAPAATAIPVTNPLTIPATLSDNGTLTPTGTWTKVPRKGMGDASGTIDVIQENKDIPNTEDVGFNNFVLDDNTQIGDTDKFAIAITIAYVSNPTVITVNSVNLSLGNIPCRPSPKSFAETLKECERFYETTYNPGTSPGTVQNTGTWQRMTASPPDGASAGGTVNIYSTGFIYNFNTTKRIAPSITFYDPKDGNSGKMHVYAYTDGVSTEVAGQITVSTHFKSEAKTIQHSYYIRKSGAPAMISTTGGNVHHYGFVNFHTVIDARYGVV